MADDDLIAGAAAPASQRLVRSPTVLDSLWVLAVSIGFLISSRIPLIDLEDASLETGEAPLRGYTVVLPALAIVLALAAVVTGRRGLSAAATGVLVPSIAFAGSLGGSLFVDDGSPFTDAGVPLTLTVALVGVVMYVRWFVYAPTPAPGIDPRPSASLSAVLVALGVTSALLVVVDALGDDTAVSRSFVVGVLFMLVTAAVVVSAGLLRVMAGHVLAGAACCAHVASVLLARFDTNGVDLSTTLTLRTGVPGLIVLGAAAGVAVAAVARPVVDAAPIDDEFGKEDWRWSFDDR